MNQSVRTVETELLYLAPGSFVNRRFVSQGREVNTGRYERYPVSIGDARPLKERFRLDSHGFRLARHQSRVQDFLNPDEVERVYPAEARTLIRELTGADEVVVRGWMVRTSGDIPKRESIAGYRHHGGVQPPAGEVHVDFSPECAEALAAATYAEAFPGAPPYRRFIITSLWRAFSPPPQDWPLALCDGSTVGADEGTTNALVVVDQIPDHDTMMGEWPEEALTVTAHVFRYHPGHRWWYFSEMTKDEVVLLKFHDSVREGAWRVPHTAFFDSSAMNPNVRWSIELRSVAYFL